MSFRLYTPAGDALDLGDPFHLLTEFKVLASIIPPDDEEAYRAVLAVPQRSDDQLTDAELDELSTQAQSALDTYSEIAEHDHLTWILEQLADPDIAENKAYDDLDAVVKNRGDQGRGMKALRTEWAMIPFDDDYTPVVKAAARVARTIKDAVVNPIQMFQRSLDLNALASILATQESPELIITALHLERLDPGLDAALRVAVRNSILAGGKAALPEVAALTGSPEAALQLVFDRIDHYAVGYAREVAGRLVTAVSGSTHDALSLLTSEWIAGGKGSPRAFARTLHDYIGLLPRQVQAIERRAMQRRTDGMSEAQVAKLRDKEAAAALRYRATVIARTEVLDAVSAGQEATWAESAAMGFIDQSRMVKKWLTTPDDRLDEECAKLEGVAVDVSEIFPGTTVRRPPLHPQCRCAIYLARRGE